MVYVFLKKRVLVLYPTLATISLLKGLEVHQVAEYYPHDSTKVYERELRKLLKGPGSVHSSFFRGFLISFLESHSDGCNCYAH